MRIFSIETVYRSAGNKTPGVDGKILTKGELLDYVDVLTRENLDKYRASPIKRVFIPETSGDEMRPLGIPTIKDRIVQTLFVQIIEPAIDPHADKYSFGYRKGRNAHQAIGELARILYTKPKLTRKSNSKNDFSMTKYIYTVGLRRFFDSVSHDYLVNNYPIPRSYKKLLRE